MIGVYAASWPREGSDGGFAGRGGRAAMLVLPDPEGVPLIQGLGILGQHPEPDWLSEKCRWREMGIGSFSSATLRVLHHLVLRKLTDIVRQPKVLPIRFDRSRMHGDAVCHCRQFHPKPRETR